jgi:FAD/FMN-containing dehydrogenase
MQDWTRKYIGQSNLVCLPESTHQVAKILSYCNENSISVVPQGGNTGLVGGGVPIQHEIILSTKLMDNITSFDSVSGILTCQAGCILQNLDSWLRDRGFIMPLDLGAKGSCQIGGNVATNAGGLRLLRYGSLRGNILSLEVVLPNGSILDLGKPLRKDNTGYDLKQLFIGSEGTLGVITSVSILTPQKPNSVNVAILALKSFENVQKVFIKAKKEVGEILSAFEFFDHHCFDLVQKHRPDIKNPFNQELSCKFYVLLETSGSFEDHDREKLENFLESALNHEMVLTGAVAQDDTQTSAFWSIREYIPEACAKEGNVHKYDVSLPVNAIYDLVINVNQHIKSAGGENFIGVGFGHLGDGNLHLNVISRQDDLKQIIEPYIYEAVQRLNGSISAEHGIGQMKSKYLQYAHKNETIELMKAMKNVFDPNGILNPNKMLP